MIGLIGRFRLLVAAQKLIRCDKNCLEVKWTDLPFSYSFMLARNFSLTLRFLLVFRSKNRQEITVSLLIFFSLTHH